MTQTLQNVAHEVLEKPRLLNHPFYQRWERGELASHEMTSYAEQYRYFEKMLPDFLHELADQLPTGSARSAVESNLHDEVSTPSHVELFEKFAAHYGATNADISPAMRNLLQAYRDVLDRGPVSGLAGLLAYELQGAEIANSKANGLARHFAATDEALEFWKCHGSLEADHAQWTLDALDSLDFEVSDVTDGMDRVASAWWLFLDERELLKVA